MSIVLSVLQLILWLLVVPFCVGLLFNFILPVIRRTVGITFILGFLVYMAVFEIVAIACMTKMVFSAFTYCRVIFGIIVGVMAVLGIVRSLKVLKEGEWKILALFPGEAHADARTLMNPRSDLGSFKAVYPKESRVCWIIFFCILAFQMVMAVVMASFDGDDAYYVAESLLAQQVDVMNTILPYTGTSTSLDIRHALAVITMWEAFVAKMSGIHATIVAHSILPLFILPLIYLVYVEIGRILFRNRQQVIPVFMIVVSVLLMFGNVSIYTPATFMFMRTWQGKALVGNLVFPMIFWVFMWMLEDSRMSGQKKKVPATGTGTNATVSPLSQATPDYISFRSGWIMLALINMLSGVCSSMGVIFGSGLVALLTLILLVFSRRLTVLIGSFLCIVPNLIYLGIYFSLFSR